MRLYFFCLKYPNMPLHCVRFVISKDIGAAYDFITS